ncbi:MAG: hypothetical protein ACFFB6_03345 [Promethearchaeota archaeon]
MDEILKLSNSPITIITPENKTYTEPMSGYYPASYGFENDNVGDNPKGWSTTEPSGCGFVEVDASLNGHNKIVEVRKNGGTTRVLIEKSFEENLTEGTVEYWLYKDTASGTDGTIMYLLGDVDSAYYLIENGNLYRGPYPSRVLIANGVFSANTWYHFRIDFNISQGYQIYLDGILYGAGYSLPFDGSPSYIRGFRLRSHWSGCHSNYGAWLDAFNYDWDDDYNVGDNKHEGLLLSYTSTTNLDWIGYSLDGQFNKTIIGNTTITMPNEGLHNIQVFGNNSLGEIFESDMRYFTIKYPPITIITPENKTYTEPMSGYYPASYGFENDNVGDNPKGWSTTEPSGCGFVEVDASLNGHNKIVEVRKNGGTTRVLIEKSFEENLTEGTVEYWLYKDTASGTDGTIIYLVGDVGSAYFLIENGNLYRGPYPSRVLIASGVFSANTWYHFRIDFDVSQGYQIYLDGILYGAGYSLPFDGSPSYIRGFRLRSHYSGCHPDYGAWLDAFSYDWDDDYNVGDNLNEGLLIGYRNRTSLEWIGYSLDGQLNKTIIGNTVIPLSGNGFHNIRLYGRNSSGFIFESPVRYFTIDIPAPQILINYPHNGDNLGLSAPDFSISISTPILDTTWYTMDNGITKIIFNGLSGTIDQNEWDKFGFESVIIRFYINDTFGQESYSEVTINKNPNPPPPLTINFFIVLIIISIGIVVLEVIIISIVRRKKSTRSATIGREEIIVVPQFLKCPYCQNELKLGYNFCIHCGSKLK